MTAKSLPPRFSVLVADDDEDDRLMTKDAFVEAGLGNELFFVNDGEELLDYLRQVGMFAGAGQMARPDLILLDLNMPKKNGREALKEIKQDPALKSIPVVIFTTSKSADDISCSYDLGANSFVVKPVTFSAFVELAKGLGRYWREVVELPKTAH